MSVGISKTRCLFVLPDLSGGGAEKVTLTLLKQLDRNRFEPSLLLFRQTGPFLAEVPADIPLAAALPGQHKGMLDSLAILLAIKRAARGADVVIGSLELQGIFFAVIGAALARRPSIAWVHKHLGYYLAHKPALARSVYWLVCALVFSLATRVVTVCAESADSIGRLFRWRRRVIGYHYNPVDFAEIDRLTTVEAGSAAVRDVRQILAVGRLTPQKGFDLLLQAMSLVVKQMPDARLCILGEGELRPGLEALRQRLGLSDARLHHALCGHEPGGYFCHVFAL
jgi:glycosyltransferase involved in cell wall biosynthesis